MFATVPESIKQQRLNICKTCDSFKAKFCTECGCYMPAKTAFAKVKCPLNKWTEAESGEGIVNDLEQRFLDSWNQS